MGREGYMQVLSRFVTGELPITRLKEFIEKRLMYLRQSSEVTEEKRLLSKVELYLHEADEGLRPQYEVYILAQSTVDQTPARARVSQKQRQNVETSVTGPPTTPFKSTPIKFHALEADQIIREEFAVPFSR